MPEIQVTEHGEELRRKAGRFRILIIGRANAGKTTILQKVCNTPESPEIYNAHGKKVDTATLDPSSGRGWHDINNEIVFQSNPGFIFHDSRGFEAGTAAQLNDVKEFIKRRAGERKLVDQLHAIWYCIPMDNPRPVTKAEEFFFSECGTGHVPVIVIFSKFDALDDKAFAELEREYPNLSLDEVAQRAPARAYENFEKLRPRLRIYHGRYPPKDYTYLRDMNKPMANCFQLLEKTAAALDNQTLEVLFVSTQQCNVRLCTNYAMWNVIHQMEIEKDVEINRVYEMFLAHYPHFWVRIFYMYRDRLA